MLQTTIKRRIECEGIGLHGGKMVRLVLRPAAEDTGIVFHVPGPHGVVDIFPTPDAVIATGLATTLGRGNASVSTVEHLLAALRGLGIDNVHVEAKGGEIPIMDGSAEPFVSLLQEAGIRYQQRYRRVLRIARTVHFAEEGKSIVARPYDGFRVDCVIDFPHPSIGRQRMVLDVTPSSFARIAAARTFGFARDVQMLQERGLALGGSLDNAIALSDTGVLNEEGLRYADEFVRHKLLDFVGDMSMLPLPLQGSFVVHCSGHALNNRFLRHVADNASSCLTEVNLGDSLVLDNAGPMRTMRGPVAAGAFAG
ncbi:UDP-3-O-acyl-N-acetylglucosamine deacetylase [Desulfovibrio sp. OttesenSCG-928-G15]|nr:UDP-3-O-acyl-N-acetylglucosamine deacetylase [Desulfovibrio sp. OttesenSCG-928-G15]